MVASDRAPELERILVADDDPAINQMLIDLLTDEGYEVEGVFNGDDVIKKFNGTLAPYSLLLLDVQMPGMSGLDLLEKLRAAGNDIAVIMITANSTSSVAIKAIQMGAYDYIQKPFDIDAVSIVVKRFFEYKRLTAQVHSLTQRAASRDRMIGDSPAMLDIYKTVGRVANTDASVLITGETGTGKELAASLIHQNSYRQQGPFIKVNCAALPETLIESELFGHEKGAFTGAVAQRKGRFEQAHKGTVFLDEVGEISLSVQKKLLRVLQEGEIERVGGSGVVKVDVRVLTATNRDLMVEVRKGSFREDLFYRLNVVNLHMPPLRERRSDIPLLAEHFLDKYRYTPGAPPCMITQEALQKLEAYDWPGNVRQLENEIERAVALSQGRMISSQVLTLSESGTPSLIDIATRVRNRESLKDVLAEVEQTMLREALRQVDNNDMEAARLIGLTREEFSARIQRDA